MTCLPPARVKSPVCDATILSFGFGRDGVGEALGAVDRRRGAGGALELDDVDRRPVASLATRRRSQSPAFLPSSTKSEPRNVL